MKELNCSGQLNKTSLVNFDEKLAISIVVALFLIIGSVGNIITIIVIIKNKCLQIPSNYFIVSLSISDLISALICSPLWLYRRTWGFERWQLSEELCELYWTVDFTTSYVTSLHILSFAFLRCFAVYFPFRMSMVTKRRILIFIITLWVIAFSAAAPLIGLTGVVYGREYQKDGNLWPSCSIDNHQDCADNSNHNLTTPCCIDQYNIYTLVTSTIFFFTPEIFIIVFSIGIAKALLGRLRWRKNVTNTKSRGNNLTTKRKAPEGCSNDLTSDNTANGFDKSVESNNLSALHQGATNVKPGVNEDMECGKRKDNREKKIFTQLGLIIVAFMIGYLPPSIYLVWTSAMTTHNRDVKLDYWFGVASYLCVRLSECLNPLMYNLGCRNIRRETLKLLKLN